MPSSLFGQRKDEEELMDLPATSREDFIGALADIRWVNRQLGGTRTLLDEVARLLPENPPAGPLQVLDLGTGSADIPIALVEWGRTRGITFKITAVDIHPVAVEIGNLLAKGYSEITLLQADALALDFPDQAFDLAVSSMFMHHLKDTEAVRLLQEMDRLSRIGWVVNDLERHPLAWLAIHTLGPLTGKGRIFRNDAPLSVLRAFSREDLDRLAGQSGLPGIRIQRRSPYRWVISRRKPGEGDER